MTRRALWVKSNTCNQKLLYLDKYKMLLVINGLHHSAINETFQIIWQVHIECIVVIQMYDDKAMIYNPGSLHPKEWAADPFPVASPAKIALAMDSNYPSITGQWCFCSREYPFPCNRSAFGDYCLSPKKLHRNWPCSSIKKEKLHLAWIQFQPVSSQQV